MNQTQQATNSPKLFILPKDNSSETRIVTLPDPRTSNPCRYLFCPEKGLYEFTKIGAPKSAPRSLLISRPLGDGTTTSCTRSEELEVEKQKGQSQDGGHMDVSKGYVSQAAEYFVATPMDPLFLILPALAPRQTSKKAEMPKQLFLSLDDHLDGLSSASSQFSRILWSPACRRLFEQRLYTVCDSVEAGDERMYRLNEGKLLKEIVRKAQNMIAGGLPASLEEKFVTRALEVPLTSIKREESSLSNMMVEGDKEITLSCLENSTSTTNSDTSSLSRTSISTSQTTVTCTTTSIPSTPSENIIYLLRLHTALTYLMTNYLPSQLSNTLLTTLLSSPSASSHFPDFTPLNSHLTHLSILRESAINSRSLSDFSRKHSLEDEDEETRAEKKRRKEEEEEKKRRAAAGQSRALKDLKKVDVTGMKKLSDFFGGAGGGKKAAGGTTGGKWGKKK